VYVRDSLGPPSHEIGLGSLVGVEYPDGHPNKARLLQSRPVVLDHAVWIVVLAIGIAFIINPKWMDLIW
jgi:hypothetical protein